jgi:hypothetical protein
MNAYVHRDERHEYTDAVTGKKRMSMDHIHIPIVAEVGGKLNGKAFSSRKNMRMLNNSIHKMSQDEFGVDFMTGEQSKSKETTESLKYKSKIKELEMREESLCVRGEELADEREKFEEEKKRSQSEQDAREERLNEQARKNRVEERRLSESRTELVKLQSSFIQTMNENSTKIPAWYISDSSKREEQKKKQDALNLKIARKFKEMAEREKQERNRERSANIDYLFGDITKSINNTLIENSKRNDDSPSK